MTGFLRQIRPEDRVAIYLVRAEVEPRPTVPGESWLQLSLDMSEVELQQLEGWFVGSLDVGLCATDRQKARS